MVIFNSYVNLPEGNHHLIEGPGWFQRKPCCRWRPVLHLGGLKSVTVFLLDQPFGGVSEHGVGASQNGSFFISDTYDIMINLVDLGYLFGPKSVLDLEMIWFRRVQKNIRMWPVWSVPLPRTCLSSLANMLLALRRCLVDQCKFTSQQMAAGLHKVRKSSTGASHWNKDLPYSKRTKPI